MGGRWGLLIILTALLPSILPQQPPPPAERCKKPLVRGPCTDWQDKWYFNQSMRTCRTFRYGGCQGENVFDTEVQCLHYCIGGDHTLPPKNEGEDVELIEVTSKEPLEDRGTELTFLETGDHRVFTMAKSNAFIQLDGHRIKTFQLRLCREISFQFRTRLPHGLLVYHSIKNRPDGLNPYALYIIVEKGQLKVVHVFGKHSTSVIVGEGLNRDRWHSVTVTIDVHGARLIAKVGDQTQETLIQGLHPSRNYDVASDLESVVLIGGLSPEEKLHGVKYIIESFVGCIKDMVLSAGKAASDLLPIKPLIATKHENVQEGCIDKCLTRENLCFEGSTCTNHYNSFSCDCFGTCHEGELCDIYTATILTLRGSSYVSYRVYDWKDRVHSSSNRISLHFMTRFDDSALFYASGESPAHHHIAVSLVNYSVVVDVDLGDGNAVTNLGPFTVNQWHNLTLSHDGLVLTYYMDGKDTNISLSGSLHHLYIDPEIYIGGGPELHKRKGLRSLNNFVGALKYVFFNDVSILYELNKTNPKVHYIGVLEPEFSEVDVDVIPMTFAFPSSHFWWEIADPSNLSMSFDFKSSRSMAVLASAELGSNYWQLRQVNEEIRFEVTTDVTKNISYLTSVKYDNREAWHTVELSFSNGEISLNVDYIQKTANLFGINWTAGNRTIIGSTHIAKGTFGLVGCMRKVVISGVEVEPRFVVRSDHLVGTVSLDNCELVDPCKRPNACEHNGRCSVAENGLTCDCEDTGYIGKNCHFAKFRKTCEELALLGYTKPDVYLIDIDGNGRFPPAHVKCEFQSLEDSTKTIVEHNLPSQVDVRSLDDQDFSYTITYREFTREMLQELISHSLYCSQHIKYDCYKAPLDLHSATWFFSAANNGTVDYLGNSKRGTCPCAENRTCVNPDMSCNCDMSEAKWHSDEGFYVSVNSLGITQMVFLQQKDLEKDAIGRITLGPLECVETNTQKYVVTFTTSQSYIEVPGWRKGDIAFSFRTTGERAILLYQPPIRPHHPSFMVALTSDFQLTFNFTLNTGVSKELAIKSQRRLNSGEWQKIWIDYNKHHVRFMINTDYQMVDLQPEEEFGPFEGSMFIGGATEDMLVKGSVREGLIGCFRGLVVNGEILDIYSYMSVHLSEIIKDCKPSCDPNPCKNGAKCKELWSSFQCVCENPWAYIGTYCETNINENGMTLVSRESFYKRSFLSDDAGKEKQLFRGLLTENLLLNLRTYDQHSLVLHANDHLNNFIMLYITDGSNLVFLFNSNHTIINLTVNYPELASGKSVQIAIRRSLTETQLHVNERNSSIQSNLTLLTEYSQRPWENSIREVLAPQRPPSSPTEYFQVSVGGYDDSLLPLPSEKRLDGYVGCIRGLKIGSTVVNLTNYINSANKSDVVGMVAGCRMKCDEQPCKNQGVCIEDFLRGESSCDCEYTSYMGEMCTEEKGATFSGDSVLQRKFVLEGPVYHIKVQLAFSTFDERQRNSMVLLLQTENKRSYYLKIVLSGEGDLFFMEDQEGSAYGVLLKDRYFLNNARHSVYYKRNNDSAFLLIDRELVALTPYPALSLSDVPDSHPGSNEVQIGGLNTSDPRFTAYSSFTGCLSNVLLEVNGQVMKPLDEYMVFTKSQEDIIVKNAQGIRIAQCAGFDEIQKPPPGPTLNISTKFGSEAKQWVEDPPARIPYKSSYSDSSTKEEGTGRVLFIMAVGVFVTVISGTLYHVYRSHIAYKKRKEAEDEAALWRATSQQHYQDKPFPPPAPHPPNPLPQTTVKSIRSRSQDDATIKQNFSSNDLKPAHKSSPATPAPTVRFRIPPEDHHSAVRENGVVSDSQRDSLEDTSTLDEVRLKLLKPTQSVEIIQIEPIVRSPSMDVVSCTINEDSAGEREEENNEVERKIRPKSIDLGYLDKTARMGSSRSISGSTASIKSDVSRGSVSRWKRLLSPIYLADNKRTFGNPLSYIGGPRFFSKMSLKSKESILSVD